MRKVKTVLTMMVFVFSVMLCCSFNAFALTDGDWEFQLLANEVKLTGYIGEGGDVIIPEMVYGCPVTEMDEKLLCQYIIDKDVTSIVVEAKVKEIPGRFAESQKKLKKVILPEGVETLANHSFAGCEGLTEIYLPSTLKTISLNAFEKCLALKNISLPAEIQKIDSYAFVGAGLTEIDLSNVKGEYGGSAFQGCKSLKSVKLSASVAKVPLHMFMDCSSLSELEIPDGITHIEEQAFDGCASLERVVLPSSLELLHHGSFARTGLREIIIPYGTKSLWGKVLAPFYNCNNLQAVFVPDTVTDISGSIISGCPDAIIYCSDNSHTAQYCKEKKMSYLTDSSVNSGVHVLYNGKRISFHSYGQNPEIMAGRTLVPLRSIFEAMGAEVEWDGNTNTATAKRGNITVKVQIGASSIDKNGKAIPIDVPAQLMNSRTMVPARVIAEAFGADVQWNGNGRVVLISE